MRASDRDREQALDVLRRRCAEGHVSVDTFERRVELPPAAPGQWLTPHVGPLNGTGRDNRRTARAIVVPGDELWRGSCPIRPD